MAGKNRVLRLESLTHSEIEDLDAASTFVIATMSPLEVHGPHLPLGQDFMEAYAIAEAAAVRLGRSRSDWSFLLLPPVPVAADALPRRGSVNFPPPMVRDVAFHLLAPFAREGFGRLAFASFHGGPRHLCALEAASERLRKEFRTPAVSLMSAALSRLMDGGFFMDALGRVEGCRITREQMAGDRHAAFVETSIALHLWPELVGEEWKGLPDSVPERTDGGSFLFGREGRGGIAGAAKRTLRTVRSIAGSVRHFRDSTYFGYPALSSAAAGKALFDLLADLSAELGGELIDRGMEMEGHSPLWKYRHVLLNPIAGRAADDWIGCYG
jgi:creatinine amidohydrolase